MVGAAKQAGLIASAREVFDELRLKGFRISEAIVSGMLESIQERAVGNEPVRKKRRGQKRG